MIRHGWAIFLSCVFLSIAVSVWLLNTDPTLSVDLPRGEVAVVCQETKKYLCILVYGTAIYNKENIRCQRILIVFEVSLANLFGT